MAIAAQFQKLLDSCQEMEFSHLRPLVDRMFENADVALLDFAEKAESNTAQALFFEAMSEVRKKRWFISKSEQRRMDKKKAIRRHRRNQMKFSSNRNRKSRGRPARR